MRILVTFIIMLIMIPISATNYFKEGTKWFLTCGGSSSNTYPTEVYIEGDSIVNDIKCLKMWCQYNTDDPKRIALIRTEGEKVFFLDPLDAANWVLAYDFGITPGERCRIGNLLGVAMDSSNPVVMSEVEFDENVSKPSIGYDGEMMLMKEIFPGFDHIYGYWINGMGSFHGPLMNCMFDNDGFYSWLNKIEYDGIIIYNNTITGVNSVIENSTKGQCFSVGGFPIPEPEKGIFIRDGKIVKK